MFNIGIPKCINLVFTDIMEEIDSHIIKAGVFNTSHKWVDHLDRRKKKALALNTLEQMDLSDIYRTFHSRIHILLKWT